MTGILSLYERGDSQGVIVPHWGARPSWAISTAGRFSAFLSASDAKAFGLSGATAAGRVWATYQMPGLPTWGGVCVLPRYSDDEVFELAAESFHILTRKRVVPRTARFHPAPAGAIALRAFHTTQGDDYMFIRDFDADEDGDPVAVDPRGGDLYDDVFRQLVQASGQEWDVDADRNAVWRMRIGTNKVGRVMLRAPHEIVAWDFAGDLWTVANNIEGIAADQRYERSGHVFASHTDSIKTIGRYEQVKRYPDVINKATLRPLVRRDLAKTAWPAETANLTTINAGMSWAEYHVGDIVGMSLPTANAVRVVRILARSIDAETLSERLTVEVQNEADGYD